MKKYFGWVLMAGFLLLVLYNLIWKGCVTGIYSTKCVPIENFVGSGWKLLPAAILGIVIGYWKTH